VPSLPTRPSRVPDLMGKAVKMGEYLGRVPRESLPSMLLSSEGNGGGSSLSFITRPPPKHAFVR
jgi:hypothetical protein